MNYEEIIGWDKRKIKKQFSLLNKDYSREVYILNEDYVLKIPKREIPAGLKQSLHEKELYEDRNVYEDTFLCPILLEHKGRIIMKRARNIRETIQKKKDTVFYGSIYEDYQELVTELGFEFDNIKNLESLQEIVSHLHNHRSMGLGDLESTRNWGILHNTLVLLDYGLSEDIYNKYYKRR